MDTTAQRRNYKRPSRGGGAGGTAAAAAATDPDERGGVSLYRDQQRLPVVDLTSAERALMHELCAARLLQEFYYEGALSLWMRVKAAYPETAQGTREALIPHLLTALHITVKYCGPQWITDTVVRSEFLLREWPSARSADKWDLHHRELRMCQQLNWLLF